MALIGRRAYIKSKEPVCSLQVVVAELEEVINTRARVLRSLSVVSMRERHDKTGALESFYSPKAMKCVQRKRLAMMQEREERNVPCQS